MPIYRVPEKTLPAASGNGRRVPAYGLSTANGSRPKAAGKTQVEIEAAICDAIARFERDFMGRGPREVKVHLMGDLLVIRIQGVLTAAEQRLVSTLPADQGRLLLKQVRAQLIETARPLLEAMVQEITAVKPLSLHHDISTVTGEEVVLWTLAARPTHAS